ncbi:hypothetical protein SDC9_112151 [bioreactor metagenome]|uniref:Uncharacterized protein n=1 Tax=bioreactor metagenome TaxID=1076179 RepID=A0A645BJ83_9ZZZZ
MPRIRVDDKNFRIGVNTVKPQLVDANDMDVCAVFSQLRAAVERAGIIIGKNEQLYHQYENPSDSTCRSERGIMKPRNGRNRALFPVFRNAVS